jgi:signal transduction histidine kinase
VGRHLAELLASEYPHEEADTSFSTLRQAQVSRIDGTIAHVEMAHVLKSLANGPAIQMTLRDITARIEGRRRIEQLQNALVSGLIDTQEEERRTIAYDIHDGLTQYIMTANAHLEACLAAWESGNLVRTREQLGKVQDYLQHAGTESRRLVNGLRCLALEDLGLAGAVEQVLAEDKERAGWKSAILCHNLSDERFEQRVETAAFRIVQEALNNARKHAHALHVRVSINVVHPFSTDSKEASLVLEIGDDGIGLDARSTEGRVEEGIEGDNHHHVGLHGMTERVRLLGGAFSIESTPDGGGTFIRATIPLQEAKGARDERI